MRAGSFSVAKSLAAAVVLLRLAQKYGDEVGSLKIKDYVNVTARHGGWDNVTFLDALNMTTGIGNRAGSEPVGSGCCMFADENEDPQGDAFRAVGKDAMLNIAFGYGAYTWGPGVEVRYNALHTFILSAAMDSYLKRKEGPNAYSWDMVVNEVFRPIGIAHAPMMHTREPDGSRGIPLLEVGLYLTPDDTAKIAQLLHDGGRKGATQILSPTLTAIAMYRTANQGLRGFQGYDNQYGQHRYLMSFHSVPWSDGAGCTVRVPSAQGVGGNLVVMLPNGVTAVPLRPRRKFQPDRIDPRSGRPRPDVRAITCASSGRASRDALPSPAVHLCRGAYGQGRPLCTDRPRRPVPAGLRCGARRRG